MKKACLPSLFEQPVDLDPDQAKENRNLGIVRAMDHADEVHQSWQAKAYFQLIAFLTTAKGKFFGEDIRNYAQGKGLPVPPTNRAWGGIIAKAHNEGLIKRVGYGPTKNIKAHRTPASIWEKI